MFRLQTDRDFKGLVSLMLLALIGCGPSGPIKHKVTGTVLLNGKPVSGVTVTLRHTSDSVNGKYRIPIGYTDDNGVFALTTENDGDGAVEGDYIVTFVRMKSDNDLFNGTFANTNTSNYRLKIPAPHGKVEPFRLQLNDR